MLGSWGLWITPSIALSSTGKGKSGRGTRLFYHRVTVASFRPTTVSSLAQEEIMQTTPGVVQIYLLKSFSRHIPSSMFK